MRPKAWIDHPFRGVILAALLLRSLSAATPEAIKVLRIGQVTGESQDILAEKFQPLTKYLEDRVPHTQVQMVRLATIDDLLRAADENRLDFAFCTPSALIALNARHPARVIATVLRRLPDGRLTPWMAGAAFVRKDRLDLARLEDARGQRVVGFAPLALGGWLAVLREWRTLGLDETRDFRSLRFDGSYDNIVSSVCSGAVDIGVLSAQALNDVPKGCDIRVLPNPHGGDARYPLAASTLVYPDAAFAVVSNLDERLISRVSVAMQSIDENSPIVGATGMAGFSAPLSYMRVQMLMQELRVRPYESFGQLTFSQALRQHADKVALVLLIFLAVTTAMLARGRTLYRRLQASEGLRKRVFERSLLSMVVVDPASLAFIDCNPAATAAYGFDNRTHALGKTLIDVSAALQCDGIGAPERAAGLVKRALAEGMVVFEWRHKRADGSTWDAEVHLMSFEAAGKTLLQLVMVDITAKQEAEAEREKLRGQFVQAQKMESIGRLAGGVAHDFNNLLTVIIGYTRIVLKKLDVTSESERKSLEQVLKASERAEGLTRQLLAFSRKQVLQPRVLKVGDVLTEMRPMLERIVGEDVELQILSGTGSLAVRADPPQLQQVIMNLAVNARDAMPHGGKLLIDAADVECDGQPELRSARCVRLRVIDTGAGMDQDVLQHIFEPFFTTKGVGKGTGLGLAMVHGFVVQTGGRIDVSSHRDQGTTFEIFLPAVDESEKPVPAPTEVQVFSGGTETILVIEDEKEIREYAAAALREYGYRTLCAADAAEALAAVEREPGRIHLALTDVVLPHMNGRELASRLVGLRPGLKVLFMSGYTGDIIARHGVLDEGVEFIQKPFRPEELARKLRAVLGRPSNSPSTAPSTSTTS